MKCKGAFMACLILFSFAAAFFDHHETVHAFSNQVIQRGATGDDVIELQARLQYNGFYNGKIDGVYGWTTYWAVRNFQEKFGMKPVDGLVGAKTKQVLVSKSKYYREYVMEQIQKGNTFTHYGNVPLENQTKPRAGTQKTAGTNKPAQKPQNNTGGQSNQKQNTTAANMPGGFSNNDINLLAQAVYGEARGEPFEGQVAIAAVILNRIKSPLFPNTVAGVIFEPLAFTAVADGQIYMQPNERAKEAVLDAINGWDPSENAIYYFNPDTATSKWIWGRPQIKRIGKHIFCE
ncbi:MULTISPECIES: spore cortex-lytic enzyme [Bacillus]|uniref:Spore cortex-lytic enzyme n=1 Tax=Bacillus velezensis TaxID=492670 RepID=A0A7D7C8U9_BACVE|nr:MULTISPECIES: spore cortex-lytic enzyme [Bacillus]APA03179.1 spore cortex-lytic enzyme [Bacillus velezensis]ASB53601.1 N-acetylmuramoyl-L-alanine amidase [Bacillus velezensis]AXS61197.1 spore cortex-lytic enzyme [Bacillus velezensis]MCG1013966.1 spore cortex-lytic enzyme [Bacillus velezensis]MCR6605499.1 spore cortex-lytic enzyme [Bacillus velezensis]